MGLCVFHHRCRKSMNTICIPLHPDGGKYKDNSELRFALRSLERNFIGDFEVAIVSRRLPDWVQGVKHVYGEGLKSSLRTAAREFPDGFFWWYDDNCLLLPTDAETMKRTPVADGWSKPQTEWRKQLESVRVKLEEAGVEALDYSSPHGPYWFDQGMVEEGFTSLEKMSGKFPWESWILSVRQWPWVKGQTCQFYGKFKSAPKAYHRYLNYNDGGNTDELRRWLDGVFHKPSRFEKPDPEFSYTGRVRGVVIGMKNRPRWEDSCITSLVPAGIDAEVFHGTDMHAGDCPVMSVDAAKFRREFKREPLAGEIGCYSSHVSIASKFDEIPAFSEERPGWRLVFEDDAMPVNITAASLDAVLSLAESGGYDLVLLNTGKKNRRGGRPMSISPTRRSDPFTHAYIMNEKAAREISRWTMRHPIDLAISKANRIKVGLLGGRYRFDQRRPGESLQSIHRERKGEKPFAMSTLTTTFEQAFAPWSHRSADEGTDKITRHGYGPMYEEILSPLKGTCASLLEIGVRTGASLKAFQDYLGPGSNVRGVDVDVSKLKHDGLKVVKADGSSILFANSIPDSSLDVIVDDGSHRVVDQWTSFRNLWRKLKPGGRYIIEDINDERTFRSMAGEVDFRYYDRRKEFASDDLCAVFTRGSDPTTEKPVRQPGAGVIIADCACSNKRGLGNHITSICAAYAAAHVRGWEMVVVWRPSQRADCEWSDLFQPVDGVEVTRHYPASGIKQLACYYDDRSKPQHLAAAGPCRYTSSYWQAWQEMARKINLIPELALPDYGRFDALSLRLAHPPQEITDWWIHAVPDLERPFISSDCKAAFDIARARFPDARFLSDVFQSRDDAHRGLRHMQSAARDMMMLCKASRIIAVGRASTFRNIAHIGYGVPVLKIYGGPAP